MNIYLQILYINDILYIYDKYIYDIYIYKYIIYTITESHETQTHDKKEKMFIKKVKEFFVWS